ENTDTKSEIQDVTKDLQEKLAPEDNTSVPPILEDVANPQDTTEPTSSDTTNPATVKRIKRVK
ncbi:MAG: hypothetical protein WC269_03670, partial [Candidatus Gracilibacteria bacterium]